MDPYHAATSNKGALNAMDAVAIAAGAKLLAGGNYYTDFVEVNPPLCIYIYLPAVILMLIFALFIAMLLIVAIKSIAGSFFYTRLIFEQPIFKFL